MNFKFFKKYKSRLFFAIQCDETIDVAQLSQLLVYICYVGSTSIEEEMLFCRPIDTTTKAEDVFKFVASYFDGKGIQWEKRICTVGAPTMLGSRSGFVTRIKQKIPNAVGTHCVIHWEARASKTLPASIKDKLAIAIRVVNFVKANATNIRLFSKLC